MRSRARLFRAASALLLGAALAACGAGSTAPSPSVTPAGALTGPVTVFAAASLTEAFNDDRARLVAGNPTLALSFSFAGSQQLVAQVIGGAPADVVATADPGTMQKMVSVGAVEAPQTFARNDLEIVVAPGNPKRVKGLADLARGDLRVVLADPAVPAGKYARQALDRQGLSVSPVSLELDVKSELQKVVGGEADAGIVYVTDVKSAASRASGVAIPPDQNVVTMYPVAVVRASAHHAAAQAFVDQLLSGAGRDALRAQGFLSP